jgi:hypothetical protein
VSDNSPSDSWEDWLPDPLDADPDAERFKWGWNEADGEAVWEVGGPGDGWPAHRDHLTEAWGREPRVGDVLGAAGYLPARGSDPAVVSIYGYEGPVPDAVADWFRKAFPDAEVRLAGAE